MLHATCWGQHPQTVWQWPRATGSSPTIVAAVTALFRGPLKCLHGVSQDGTVTERNAMPCTPGPQGWRVEFSRKDRGPPGGGRGGGDRGGGGRDDFGRGPPGGGGGMRSEMRCYECGEMGHFARDCRCTSSRLLFPVIGCIYFSPVRSFTRQLPLPSSCWELPLPCFAFQSDHLKMLSGQLRSFPKRRAGTAGLNTGSAPWCFPHYKADGQSQ